MAGKNTAVFALFRDRVHVEQAVGALRREGFRGADISVLFPDNRGSKDFAHEKHTKAPEGAAAGGGTGAVLGGTLGWLAGIGALTVPGLGALVAAGPIMAALAGAGAGSVVGGVAGALAGLGVPEYEAKRYEGWVKNGGLLLSVHADNTEWAAKARNVLATIGGAGVGRESEARSDIAKSDTPLPRYSKETATNTGTDESGGSEAAGGQNTGRPKPATNDDLPHPSSDPHAALPDPKDQVPGDQRFGRLPSPREAASKDDPR